MIRVSRLSPRSAWLAGPVAAVALFGAGCSSGTDAGTSIVSSAAIESTIAASGTDPTVPANDIPTGIAAVEIDGAEFSGWTEQSDGTCDWLTARISDRSDEWSVALGFFGERCEPSQPLNGDHGSYRDERDVGDLSTDSISVPLGDAIVFEQTYTECTNSCTDYQETVVLVTLDDPADPRFPTLMALAPYGEIDAQQMIKIVETLRPA